MPDRENGETRRYAFLVACNDYPRSPLPNCHRDAELLFETLTKWCDYPEENVIVRELSFEQPSSPEEILDELRDLVSRTEVGDTVLFFFAGHGSGTENDAYLLLPTSETGSEISRTALSVKSISDVLREPGRVCVRVFDACHSGIDVRTDQTSPIDSTAFARALEKEKPSGLNWVTFASCKPDEYSYEDESRGQGAFTSCFSDAIRAVVDDHNVLPGSLHEEVARRVLSLSEKRSRVQTPVMNNYLPGLMSIATRTKAPVPKPEVTQQSSEDLLQRLSEARTAQGALVRNRTEELKAICSLGGELLTQHASQLDQWDAKHEVKVGSTDLIPGEWERHLVKHYTSLGFTSLHSLTSETADPYGYSIFEPRGLKPTTTYSVSSHGWPDSVALLTWEGDTFTPDGKAMCYVIPFETQVYVVVWLSVRSFVDKESGIVYTLQRFGTLDSDWRGVLDVAVQDALRICSNRIRNSVQARLDYLDREREAS